MKRIIFRSTLILSVLSSLLACNNVSMDQALQIGLDASNILSQSGSSNYAQAVKQTLELSSTRAAQKLALPGGYTNSRDYKIAMPDSLNTITSTMKRFGLSKPIDDIEILMNKGAEQAAIEAKGIFIQAVKDMTIANALSIIQGGNTAATDYFKDKTEVRLRETYLPIIEKNLSGVGFYTQYKSFLQAYNTLPIDKPNLDLEQHVLNKSLDALFTQVAKEEAEIRKDPAGKGSELINMVLKWSMCYFSK